MKDIWIEKFNFRKLIEKLTKEKSQLSLPAYQREYSWDTENWKELWEDIKEITKINHDKKEGENSNIWFIGSIIFQKKSNGTDYEIVDGQQRLITFFILFITIYSVINIDDDGKNKKSLLGFLFHDWYEKWTRDKGSLSLRIKLDNQGDQADLRNIIPFALSNQIPNQTEERKRNIIRAKNFFQQKINAKNYFDIYQTILDNFYFSLIILDEETDSEIFMTLNTAGEDLTIPDLVRSLLTRRNDYQARKFAEIWEKDVEKKVCPASVSKKNRSEKVKKFLVTFWETQENNCYKKTLDDKIYLFYRKKIKGKDQEENREFLDLLVKYAEVYEKIISADNYRWWWEQNWSFEMFNIVSNISLLNHKELFSLFLATHFQFQEKSPEEKSTITKELKKLLLWVFRAIIIKQKIDCENELRGIRINILKTINSGQAWLFRENKKPIDLIINEFNHGSSPFYQALTERRNKKDKEPEIEKFILLTYYQKKIREQGLKIDLFDYEIRRLVSQNSEIETLGENKNSLGNLTLVKAKGDHPLLPWEEKRRIYQEIENNCLINLEEKNWTGIEDINDLIEERKKYLIQDFEKLRVFEAD